MIVVLERNLSQEARARVRAALEERGMRVREIADGEDFVLGAVGEQSDKREIELLAGVARVIPISKPFKLASRELRKEDTVVQVGPVRVGGGRIAVMAGPCSVESRDQIDEASAAVKESGAVILRGGAFKPRSSPYSFQGLGVAALEMLKAAGERHGMPVVSEIVSADDLPVMEELVDILQIGARNMQNFDLLKKVGALGKPVLLKRGLAATIEDLLMSAEYLLAHGTERVILCERGIRTFETYTRNTLDLSAIPVVKKLSHLPIIVDPSHGTGLRDKVAPMALAAVVAGADGLLVEVHPDPGQALSDGPQSLFPEQFEKLMRDIEALSQVIAKEVARLPRRTPSGFATPAARSGPTDAIARVRVAYQGEPGANSENLINHYFDEPQPVPRREFIDVFRAVLEGEAEYGALPVENSLTGSIHQNYDLLLQFPDIRIVGEKRLRIIHSLIAPAGTSVEAIRRVFSHPQGLAQCARFLADHPDWEQVPFYDTAGAVAHVARDGQPGDASIASAKAAQVHSMVVLKEGIETNPQNYTRFVIIARDDHVEETDPNRGSVVFSVPDRPGALYVALKVLADRKLNMHKLESRPIMGKPWEYMFYVDLELPRGGEIVASALEELKGATENLRVLGLYRA